MLKDNVSTKTIPLSRKIISHYMQDAEPHANC